MTGPPASRAAASVIAARLLGKIVLGIGVAVLIGWAFDIEVLKSIIPGFIVMIPVTAVGLVTAGFAVISQAHERLRTAGRLAALVVATLGTAALLERITGVGLGIDLLLFPEAIQRYPYLPPGRMATNSAICILLAGISLVHDAWPQRTSHRVSSVTSGIGLAISLLAITGYLYGARPLFAIDKAAGMALLTAIAFALLHVAILLMQPRRTVVGLMLGTDLGSALLRRMLPATIIPAFALGWLWIRAQEMAMVGREGGVAIFVLLLTGIATLALFRSAFLLRRTDESRSRFVSVAEAAQAKAEDASRAKSEFLAVMSHELRTPLNAIVGYTNLLLEGIPDTASDGQREHLRRIGVGAEHLRGLIEEVLTMVQLDAGKATPRLQPVSLPGLLDDVEAIMQPIADAKGLTLIVDKLRTANVLVTDRAYVRQVLLGVMSNAVKFTPAGHVRLRSEHAGDAWRFVVEDTGVGISSDNLERVFEPFWQVEQTKTRNAEGLGLGLAVARRLVHLLNGTIVAESELGTGSRFIVTISGDTASTIAERDVPAKAAALPL